jgi:hypothetical protein
MKNPSDYRYPGPLPFEDTHVDRLLFSGRDREKESLLYMVLAEKLVLLFSKSGFGKTSLLNAGLMKELRDRDYLPFLITLKNPEVDPLQAVYSKITDTVKEYQIDHKQGETTTLWQYFKTVEFWSAKNVLLTPILIFDEFEEFFAFHQYETRKTFTEQLADLVRGRVPKGLLGSLKTDEPFPYGEKPPAVKVIISISEDSLGELEKMSQEIPAIMRNRFRLPPLNREQAREAITKPAQVSDKDIHSAKFTYTSDAVDAMIDFLSKKKERDETILADEVEPLQLQLLCQHIENEVRKRSELEGTGVVIQKSDLGGEKGMQEVLEDFYDDQINQLGSFWVKTRVRRLFEDRLISDTDRRLSLEEEQIERKAKVPKSVLSKLVDNRLLRAEPRVGSVYYELSHDALIEPIRKAHRKLKRKYRIVGGLILVLLLLLVVVPYVAITQYIAYRETREIKARINAFEKGLPSPTGTTSGNRPEEDYRIFAPGEIRNFIENHVRATERTDINSLLDDYAEEVDYYSAGVVSKDFIRKDREYFNKRWPKRTYTIIGEVQTANTSYDDEKTVQFTYDYYVQRENKSMRGTAKNSIRVKKMGNVLKITEEKQEVVKRESQ